jgi:hypothetical protein
MEMSERGRHSVAIVADVASDVDVRYLWHEAPVPDDLEITQVYSNTRSATCYAAMASQPSKPGQERPRM